MFEHKLVAVLNTSCEPGAAMNALAHMCFGLGQSVPLEEALMCRYQDQDGGYHSAISAMPFIVLAANSGRIRGLVHRARERRLTCVNFIHTMTGGGYEAQLQTTRATREEDLTYFGAVLFGPRDEVSALTKKFSLWR
jgi:hypothetical protein